MKFDEILNDGLRRAYHIALSAAEIEEMFDRKAAELARDAVRPGFRRGKVPLSVIKSSQRSNIRRTVIQERVREEVDRHFEDTGDRAYGNPPVQIHPRSDDDTGFTCELRYELFPSVPELDLSAVRLARPVVTDLAAFQEAYVEDWFNRNGELVDADADYVSAAGDRVSWSAVSAGEDRSGSQNPGEPLIVTANPDAREGSLARRSVGVRKGEELTLSRMEPGESPDLKRFTVHALQRRLPLGKTDENAESLGFESLEALNSALTKNVSAELDEVVNEVVRIRLFGHLDKALDFELPPSLLESETESIRQQLAEDRSRESEEGIGLRSPDIPTGISGSADDRGAGQEPEMSETEQEAEGPDSSGSGAEDGGDSGGQPDELMDEARQIASRRLKAGFFLSKLITEKGLPTEFSWEDMHKSILKKNPSAFLARRELEIARRSEEYRRRLAVELSEERATDFVLGLVTFTDEPVSAEELRAIVLEYSEATRKGARPGDAAPRSAEAAAGETTERMTDAGSS